MLFEAASNSRRVVDAFFIKERIEPRIVMETENVEILKALVRSEMGITIVPNQAVAREVRSRQLSAPGFRALRSCRYTGWVYQRSNKVPRMLDEMFKAYRADSAETELESCDQKFESKTERTEGSRLGLGITGLSMML